MEIKVIGCGNAFTTKNFNQQFLLEENGRKLLIDCGWTTRFALLNAGINIMDIDDIYISHLHSDHIGGLECMAFLRYDWKNRPRVYDDKWTDVDERNNIPTPVNNSECYAPRLYGNKNLIDELWDKSLRGGLESMEGFVASIETFFEPCYIEPNDYFMWEGWKCELIQQIHIMTGSTISNTFGLFLSKEGHDSIYFTTDSQHCSPRQVEIFYEKADIIIQDCECVGFNTTTKTMDFCSGVHANYGQLAGWANAIKLSDDIKKKMYLSHYQDFVLADKDYLGHSCDWDALAQDDGFENGFIKTGDSFEITPTY
jgi:ribonuclease BN (tRNA processing enzyme)